MPISWKGSEVCDEKESRERERETRIVPALFIGTFAIEAFDASEKFVINEMRGRPHAIFSHDVHSSVSCLAIEISGIANAESSHSRRYEMV